ncbi:hypothetical protein MtrunA17_Chr2g0291951 [Medicago truncatula]|uniref:Uncharacterized protein n=1 Tax=Medicago truncatula TaxID=3880 RepID=A0A396J7D2_MEDTR|nr:hypothetical protein MtrunA17_Chr2g0291951 [Medicago truncatula]
MRIDESASAAENAFRFEFTSLLELLETFLCGRRREEGVKGVGFDLCVVMGKRRREGF